MIPFLFYFPNNDNDFGLDVSFSEKEENVLFAIIGVIFLVSLILFFLGVYSLNKGYSFLDSKSIMIEKEIKDIQILKARGIEKVTFEYGIVIIEYENYESRKSLISMSKEYVPTITPFTVDVKSNEIIIHDYDGFKKNYSDKEFEEVLSLYLSLVANY